VPHFFDEALILGGLSEKSAEVGKNSIFKFTKVSDTYVEREEFYGFVFVPLVY